MIVFKQLNWDNFFSYGASNNIVLNENSVTQIKGLNGGGKSSIPLIIQEVLFGKNSKKISKSALLNRNLPSEKLRAELQFDISNKSYVVTLERKGAKVSVTILEDGQDISQHTAPATLKIIESIIGLDFNTFVQLVYQSSKSSLQFLTATDTERKKFLISLFNLNYYLKIHDKLKAILNELNKEIANLEGQISVYSKQVTSFVDTPLEVLEEVPSIDDSIELAIGKLQSELKYIEKYNADISKNEAYKEQLESIDKSLLDTSKLEDTSELSSLTKKLTILLAEAKEKYATYKKLSSLKPFCPTCKQSIDISDSKVLAQELKAELDALKEEKEILERNIAELRKKEASNKKIKEAISAFESLVNLIDDSLPSAFLDAEEIQDKIKKLTSELRLKKQEKEKILAKNRVKEQKNEKIKLEKQIYLKAKEELSNLENELEEKYARQERLNILKRAFSTNGLVSYKLEYLVKDLESVINDYLVELSRGRFQLHFILKGDKLNIEIHDNGDIVTINELSEGELSKVNVSTLLAIRKLMQGLSNTKLNLLFLDEIMGVLDNYGREDLVNVLLKEENLNTFLVTHEYEHPLVPVLSVVKENGISRIEK